MLHLFFPRIVFPFWSVNQEKNDFTRVNPTDIFIHSLTWIQREKSIWRWDDEEDEQEDGQ